MQRSMHGFLGYAKEQNLSMSQLGALLHVKRMGSCAVSDISDDLGVTTAAVSQMLDRLVDGGLVIRKEDTDDRRFKRIELTPLGEELLSGAVETRYRWVQALAGSLTPQELSQAVEALDTLTNHAINLEETPS